MIFSHPIPQKPLQSLTFSHLNPTISRLIPSYPVLTTNLLRYSRGSFWAGEDGQARPVSPRQDRRRRLFLIACPSRPRPAQISLCRSRRANFPRGAKNDAPGAGRLDSRGFPCGRFRSRARRTSRASEKELSRPQQRQKTAPGRVALAARGSFANWVVRLPV